MSIGKSVGRKVSLPSVRTRSRREGAARLDVVIGILECGQGRAHAVRSEARAPVITRIAMLTSANGLEDGVESVHVVAERFLVLRPIFVELVVTVENEEPGSVILVRFDQPVFVTR